MIKTLYSIILKLILLCAFLLVNNYASSQIIADHNIVNNYEDIPQQWIDSVKKMWLSLAGESHALAYVRGLVALEESDPKYDVSYFFEAPPQLPSNQYLRADLNSWGDLEHTSGWIWGYGEEDWFTSELAIDRTKAGIKYCHDNNYNLSAYGFVLCYDGDILDATDYLSATQSYIDYCRDAGYETTIFFATGAVDDLNGQPDERGYNKYKMYENIRQYVRIHPTRVLFDYADILCYDDDSQTPYTVTWNGNTFPVITPTNALPAKAGHIGAAGELRLAKAMWWMLARIAGWDGNTTTIPVTGITVSGAAGASTINVDNGTLQLTASVSPADASNKTVTWSVQNGTGQASISTSGLVTAISNGTVTAKATANDGSGVSGTFAISILNQTIHVSGITITGAGGSSTIATDNGTLQLSATITPADATVKTITWSVQNGTGQATISNTGLVTANTNGTVTAKATANDGSGVSGTLQITISNQVNPVTGISVTGQGGASGINANNGTLQLIAEISPATATDKTLTWSVQDGTGQASINSTGMLTAISNGTVTARATANDGSGISGTITITISNQITEVTVITVNGTGGSNIISTDNGQLQMIASILPADASNKSVTWSVQNGTGRASISSTGVLTAIANGTVSVRALSNDGSGVSGTLTVTISNQIIPVESITVSGENGASIITGENGTLQLYADVLPGDASDRSVTWSMQNGTGEASINASGLVTSISNGTVTAKAMANDGSGISGSLVITISDQIIPVSQIIVTGEGGINSISSDKGSLQMVASVSPENSSDKTVNWTVINGDGKASINSAGLLTAVSDGSVTVKASANDGSGTYGVMVITISNQKIPVSEISIQSDGSQVITTKSGTLQLSAVISPENASEKSITWTIETGSEFATITQEGQVTAVSDGNITVKAMSNDGSGKFGTLDIQITGQEVLISSIVVYSSGLAVTIDSINGTLQLLTSIYPANASNKNITWSVENITGNATIDQSGLLTAHSFGLVKVRADANDGSGICGILNIQIQGTTSVSNDPEEFLRIITSPALIQVFLYGNNYDHIRIYNVSGDLIISKKVTSDLFEIDRSHIPHGIYLLMLTGKKEMIVRKFRN